jgi:transmembrane sensor
MRQKEFQQILQKYKNGLCTPEEEALIEKWFTSMGSSEHASPPLSSKERIKQKSWTRVQDHIRQSTETETRPGISKGTRRLGTGAAWAMAAAISFGVISSVFLIVSSGPTPENASNPQVAEKNVFNNTEEIMELVLGDGSQVFLEPKSSIFFKETFDDSQRIVALEGEAFFTVSRDTSRPFLVKTNEVTTKVLGTSFTVSAFPDQDNITVSVVTGKVSVITNQENLNGGPLNETILTPNQKIVYNRNNNLVSRALVKEPVPVLPAQEVKRMHFEAAPISEIFEGLEKVYGVDIEFDRNTFSSCVLTTSIAEGSIYNRLDMICKAIDARYILKEHKIVITGDGCH